MNLVVETATLANCSNSRVLETKFPVGNAQGSFAVLNPMRFAFILGCPRSGTTVMQIMLGRHKHVLVAPETKLFYYYHKSTPSVARKTLIRIQQDLSVSLSHFLRTNRLPPAETILQLVAGNYRDTISKPEAKVFVEKSPEHSSRVEDILRCLPTARFVVLVRDGRDVAESLTRVPWIKCDLLSAICVWKRVMRHLNRYRHDPRFLFVPFETLVELPQVTMQSVVDHLCLEWDEEIILGAGDRCRSIPQREQAWKGLADKPLLPDRANRWQSAMRDADIQRLEALAGDALQQAGYRLRFVPALPTIGLRIRTWYSLAITLARLPARTWWAEMVGIIGRCRNNRSNSQETKS